VTLGESPLFTQIVTSEVSKGKIKKIKGAVKIIFNLTYSSGSDSSGEGEMIAQLKEKFRITGRNSVKAQIFTFLPKSRLVMKIQDFKASNYMVQTSKKW
jgi:hypothetical protein